MIRKSIRFYYWNAEEGNRRSTKKCFAGGCLSEQLIQKIETHHECKFHRVVTDVQKLDRSKIGQVRRMNKCWEIRSDVRIEFTRQVQRRIDPCWSCESDLSHQGCFETEACKTRDGRS